MENIKKKEMWNKFLKLIGELSLLFMSEEPMDMDTTRKLSKKIQIILEHNLNVNNGNIEQDSIFNEIESYFDQITDFENFTEYCSEELSYL